MVESQINPSRFTAQRSAVGLMLMRGELIMDERRLTRRVSVSYFIRHSQAPVSKSSYSRVRGNTSFLKGKFVWLKLIGSTLISIQCRVAFYANFCLISLASIYRSIVHSRNFVMIIILGLYHCNTPLLLKVHVETRYYDISKNRSLIINFLRKSKLFLSLLNFSS